jgi:fructose-bisphosphate aldolase class 1
MSSKHILRESFNSNKKSFVLLGDSILKNAYVSDGKSVENLSVENEWSQCAKN